MTYLSSNQVKVAIPQLVHTRQIFTFEGMRSNVALLGCKCNLEWYYTCTTFQITKAITEKKNGKSSFDDAAFLLRQGMKESLLSILYIHKRK